MLAKQPTKDIYMLKAQLEKLQVVINYRAFEALPYSEKQKQWSAWNQYYQEVKKTVVYQMFQAQREAFLNKDMPKFNELRRDIKDLREKGHIPELISPKGIDPMTFYHDQSVLNYKSIINEIALKKVSNLEF